jgi:hypothetical protein
MQVLRSPVEPKTPFPSSAALSRVGLSQRERR